MIKRILLSLILFTLYVPFSNAQHIEFKKLEFPNPSLDELTYKTHVDKHGYLWLLTAKGVTRYDGKKATTFGPNHGYLDGAAYQIVEGLNDDLWIVTNNYNLYNYRNNHFYKINSSEKIVWIDIHPEYGIYALTLGVVSHNIILIDSSLNLSNSISLPGYQPYNLLQFDKKSFLITSADAVRISINSKVETLIKTNSFGERICPRIFRVNNKILITTKKGIFEFKKDTLVFLYDINGTEIFDIKYNPVYNEMLVATSKGLQIFNKTFSKQIREYDINSSSILSILLVNKNRIILSGTQGVYLYNEDVLNYSIDKELNLSKVLFVKHENDNLYFLNNNDFYTIYNSSQGVTHKYFHEIENNRKPIIAAKSLSNSKFLIFSTTNVLFENSKAIVLKEKKINQVYGTIREQIWADSINNFYIYSPPERIITRKQVYDFIPRLQKKGIKLVLRVLEKNGDTLYYGSNKGLVKAVIKDDRYYYSITKLEGEINQVIYDKGREFICTEQSGVYIVSGKTRKKIDASNHLLSNFCNAIYLRNQYLWVSTNNGLCRINLETNKSVNFTNRDFLLDNKVNDVDFFKGDVLVATDKGVSRFKENSLQTFNPPEILLEEVLINNKSQVLKDIYESTFEQNNYIFKVTSPSYRSAPFNRFRMIINGNSLNDTTLHDETVQLFSLSPGKYKIIFDVLNVDGNWSDKPIQIEVNINPPFYKTIWFISLIILIVSGITGYIIWVTLTRQKEIQEYKQKISESELRSLRLYMNPHFLFNSLTSLQSFILTVKTEDANKFITKFSKLIRSVMTYSVRGELTLDEEMGLLDRYLELESVRFSKDFTYKITCEDNIDTSSVVIPSLIIQPFVENAIKHGVTGLNNHPSYINIHFKFIGDELYCTVIDNGKGMPLVPKVDKAHISSGTKFTEERIRLMTSKKNKQVIKIEDTNPYEFYKGTTVTILVPVLNTDEND